MYMPKAVDSILKFVNDSPNKVKETIRSTFAKEKPAQVSIELTEEQKAEIKTVFDRYKFEVKNNIETAKLQIKSIEEDNSNDELDEIDDSIDNNEEIVQLKKKVEIYSNILKSTSEMQHRQTSCAIDRVNDIFLHQLSKINDDKNKKFMYPIEQAHSADLCKLFQAKDKLEGLNALLKYARNEEERLSVTNDIIKLKTQFPDIEGALQQQLTSIVAKFKSEIKDNLEKELECYQSQLSALKQVPQIVGSKLDSKSRKTLDDEIKKVEQTIKDYENRLKNLDKEVVHEVKSLIKNPIFSASVIEKGENELAKRKELESKHISQVFPSSVSTDNLRSSQSLRGSSHSVAWGFEGMKASGKRTSTESKTEAIADLTKSKVAPK